MESIVQWLTLHAEIAPLIIFGLLLLAGFSFPISEDLLVIASGVLASTVMPEKMEILFIAVFLGSYLSDWVAYGIGRFFGDKLPEIRPFKNYLQPPKMAKLKLFFKRWGIWTMVLGRCIPFGFRNGIFMTAGMGKMHFGKFLISDGIACLGFSAFLFFSALEFSQHAEYIHSLFHRTSTVVFLTLAVLFLVWATYAYFRRQRDKGKPQIVES